MVDFFRFGNMPRRMKTRKIQLSVLLLCGFSYLLLYYFFSQEIMSSLLSWQDHDFHLRLLRILENQNTYSPFFDEHPVPYPVLFHNIVRATSAALDMRLETALLFVSCLAGFGFSFLIFLVISRIFGDNLAGFVGALLLGVGANFAAFFSRTIFFGGAFIFPISYLVAGFLPNLLGHFFGLFMLYMITRSKVQSLSSILSCSVLGAMLILSHPIASITYFIATVCLFISSYMTHESIGFRRFGVILLLSITISSPWWLEILSEFFGKPYLILLSDAGINRIGCGLLTEITRYYGFVPIFSFLGIIHIARNPGVNIFIFFWLILISMLLLTPWGGRFVMELAIPLYMLGAVGISQTVKWATSEKDEWFIPRLAALIFTLAVLCDSIRIFEITRDILVQRLL
ncbi:MAG: hypothetical protein WBA22_04115 [Candidatus Methanofastidiosia archaeon]